ncbi:pyridoxamine 5'-phosphate oxidase family protein [Natrinema limicola]|uniref:Flavin-nucleotide-binding protein-like protein n=1 Tax=Natrinema limicola JCM 13563 TaxID=1230457 RepID=M0CQB4_9EURY|nr:pyridoxamine 5'-phosphate oxidase family protein [Natrinema limicola]ELZ24049.1 flavin-nucleotide-binding protein-like protein [Natrinema limicola JCM 13563]
MQGLRWLQMSDDEIADFLGRGGTGVLSFAPESDEPPVSIPVSYGYNADEKRLYYQLSTPEDSRKSDLIDQPVSFVVYGRSDGKWESVIATGTLDDIEEKPYESSAVQGMWAIQIPHVDIFERPRDEVTFHFFSLDPDTLTGRKEVPSRS